MPSRPVALHKALLDLREVLFPDGIALFDDVDCPGLFSGFAAAVASQRWADGYLVLWAAAEGGGQVAWRPGLSIDWPRTTCDVVITEQRGAGLLAHMMGEGDPPAHRRGNIFTSAAGAKRLQTFVKTKLKEEPSPTTAAEVAQFLRTQGPLSDEAAEERLAGRFGPKAVPRSLRRQVHGELKLEEAFKPKRGPAKK